MDSKRVPYLGHMAVGLEILNLKSKSKTPWTSMLVNEGPDSSQGSQQVTG